MGRERERGGEERGKRGERERLMRKRNERDREGRE